MTKTDNSPKQTHFACRCARAGLCDHERQLYINDVTEYHKGH